MVTLGRTQSRFRSLLASRVECPLCGASDVDYEFVLNRAAFSRCRGCGLLFASPGVAPPAAAAADPFAGAPIAELMEVVKRYAGRIPERPVIVGPRPGANVAGIPVRDVASLDDGQTFDAILLPANLERDGDPAECLTAMAARLEPGGTIVLLAPSTASHHAQRQRAAWMPLRAGDRFFFSPDNLQLLATRCGLGDFLSFVDARDLADKPSDAASAWFRSNVALVARPVRREVRRPLLSVIFPVYNEVSTVDESLRRVLSKSIDGTDIEVVIVESNSTDGSRRIVERYREHPRVRVVFEERPRGKGHAVRAGLDHARGDVILFQDADLEYDVEDYDELVKPLFALRRNFILGSRHNARGEAWKIRHFVDQPGLSVATNLAHVVLLTMFNVLYRTRLRDPFTMYKVFRRDCLFGLTFECNRFDFDYEISIKLLRKGYTPNEIPVNYTSRSFRDGKKVSFFGDPPTWIRAMLRLRRSRLYESLATPRS